ncbi:hypothetical protein TBK1r_63410 [Stieleria magnilauensis]|uniref:Uncharacterized protein n=1 Tax=Stieleria magnilauensis TaxID=2527963 RepID=A0ABX5Y037_9BACT|nr:hypothetical protein TBK1r_63410 [Planctomycetes bacterium TBK1r]
MKDSINSIEPIFLPQKSSYPKIFLPLHPATVPCRIAPHTWLTHSTKSQKRVCRPQPAALQFLRILEHPAKNRRPANRLGYNRQSSPPRLSHLIPSCCD